MSKSLVRRSLELFGYENNLKKDTKNKKRRNKSKGAAAVLDSMPIHHRIISKKNNKQTIKLSRSSKLNVQEAKKQFDSKVDPTEENVKRLLLLSGGGGGGGGGTIDRDTLENVLSRALKKSYLATENKSELEESTAFTEEDFKKFEEEYCEL